MAREVRETLRFRYCAREFGWDWWTYVAQPADVLEQLLSADKVAETVRKMNSPRS